MRELRPAAFVGLAVFAAAALTRGPETRRLIYEARPIRGPAFFPTSRSQLFFGDAALLFFCGRITSPLFFFFFLPSLLSFFLFLLIGFSFWALPSLWVPKTLFLWRSLEVIDELRTAAHLQEKYACSGFLGQRCDSIAGLTLFFFFFYDFQPRDKYGVPVVSKIHTLSMWSCLFQRWIFLDVLSLVHT